MRDGGDSAHSRRSAGPVQSNISAIAEMQRKLEQNRNLIDRVADLIATFSGSMAFVFVHVVLIVGWFLWNTGVIPDVKRFDPYPFILLAMIVSVEGVLLSTFVLMKQNRMQRKSDARDHVNLQIDLLAEKEITKSLTLLRAICHKLELSEAEMDAELEEMLHNTPLDLLTDRVERELLDVD